MMRKKILSVAARLMLVLAAVCVTVSCGDDPVPPQAGLALSGTTITNQVLYADQTVGESQIKFTANGTWVASVMSVPTRETYREPVTWLRLSDCAGGAGENVIDLTLTENTTGQARKAQVDITCAGTTVTVTVEQKAERKDTQGGVDIKGSVQQVTCKMVEDGVQTGLSTMHFTYDAQGRLASMVQDIQEMDEDSDDDSDVLNIRAVTRFTYGTGTASYSVTYSAEGVTLSGVGIEGNAKLDAQGRVVSGTCQENGLGDDDDDDDDDESDSETITYSLSYDADGYLQKSEGHDSDGAFSTMLSWQGGNLMGIDWNTGSVSGRKDSFTYGTQQNCANIDLNWLVAYDSDGADLASGDPYRVFGVAGMLGRRARNMSTGMTDVSGNKLVVTYECDAAGRPVKIVLADDDDSVDEHEEYTITYAK